MSRKFTVITENDGRVTGIAAGHSGQPGSRGDRPGEMHGGLIAGPNQKMHEVELPDEVTSITDPATLHEKIKAHLRKS